MSAVDMVDTVTNSAGSLIDRIDADRVAAAVSDVALGELIAATAPVTDAAADQIVKTARLSWRLRRQLAIGLLIGLTLGVTAVVIRRRRSDEEPTPTGIG